MFPIPFNIPFRKKDGSLSTLGDELNNGGGGGGSYTLPTASADVKGGVKIGEGLTMDGEVLKNTNPTPATPYTLPTASTDVKGGVKIGEGLSITNEGVLSASGGGVTFKTITLSFTNVAISANSFTSNVIQSTDLYNKTVLGVHTDISNSGVCFGRVSDYNNKKLIDVFLFNSSASSITISRVYVTYVD